MSDVMDSHASSLPSSNFDGDRTRSISLQTAASKIGVSAATLRNWVKAGQLTPDGTRPLTFHPSEVERLRADLHSGRNVRLQARANKTIAPHRITPREYANKTNVFDTINRITEISKTIQLPTSAVLFIVALRLLELHGEVSHNNNADAPHLLTTRQWKRRYIHDEMTRWHSSITMTLPHNPLSTLYKAFDYLPEGDALGLLYQALSSSGVRSIGGSYFTPSEIVVAALEHHHPFTSLFLDPCCGTGQYLLHAASTLGLSFEQIYGFDIDPLAVRIARINLLLAFPNQDRDPNISCLDSISELATGDLLCSTNHVSAMFGLIATNPPWGSYRNTCIPHNLSKNIVSGETFSLFIAKAIQLTQPGGAMSFILPEAILSIKVHADIRRLLLERTHVVRISKLGRRFSSVFTPAIRLDLVNTAPMEGSIVQVDGEAASTTIEQVRFLRNTNYTFDIDVTERDDLILQKLYSGPHTTLKGHADWALGIVTGNNKEFVKDHSHGEMEPIYKGSDIDKFFFKKATSYITFRPEQFQQVAKTALYRAPEKLVYKFISNSLVFAYDAEQRLTLNSANIVIPRMPDISIKVALGFLNSKVFQYVFLRKFATRKVLRGDLEGFPFPITEASIYCRVEHFVESILRGENRAAELDKFIYSIFNLSGLEIATIESVLVK